jgi:hypothetical protein
MIPRPLLDEAKHQYTVNGFPKVSVTQCLGEYIKIEAYGTTYYVHTPSSTVIDAFVMERAAAFGRSVHKGAYYLLTGKGLKWSALDPALVPVLRQLENWMEKYRPKVILCEEPLYSAQHDYCGTPDLVCELRGFRHLCIPDLKTTGLTMTVGPQTAGYEALYRENYGYKGMIDRFKLVLPKDGSDYRFEQLTGRNDFNYFLWKLNSYNWLRAA